MRRICLAWCRKVLCAEEVPSVAEGRVILIISAATVFVLMFTAPANAQAIPLNDDDVSPPWNALQVFESSPLPDFRDPDYGDPIPPEDMPVMAWL